MTKIEKKAILMRNEGKKAIYFNIPEILFFSYKKITRKRLEKYFDFHFNHSENITIVAKGYFTHGHMIESNGIFSTEFPYAKYMI